MKKLFPNIMVKNVQKTVAFYEKNLGFKLEMSVPEEAENMKDSNVFFEPIDPDKKYLYALMKNENVEIAFQEEESLKKDVPALQDNTVGFSGTLYIEVENVEDLYQSIKDTVEVLKEPFTTWYGMRELYVRDLNGYILTLAETDNNSE